MTNKPETRYLIAPILEEYFEVEVPDRSKMTCPFHADNNPSAWHNDYYFKCYGCGVQGDAIGLLIRQGEVSDADAYEIAERLAGKPDGAVREQSVPRRGLSGGPRTYTGNRRAGTSRRGR